MNSKRQIGIHFRLTNSFSKLAQEALELKIPTFQLFLMPQGKNKYLRLTQDDRQCFDLLRKNFDQIYVHSSYWINLTHGNTQSSEISESLFKKEIKLAQKLKLNALVIHPGSAKEHPKTEQDPEGKLAGIAQMAKILNKILKTTDDLMFLFENTPHGSMTVGSDLNDFAILKSLIDEPDKIGFCLDLAHAFTYGYDISNVNDFLQILDQTMGLDKIKLIHLHDSVEDFASKKDRHTIPGEGKIGIPTLKNLVTHQALKHIPLILELPPLPIAKIEPILEEVRSWI